jgi:hypothetical protein
VLGLTLIACANLVTMATTPDVSSGGLGLRRGEWTAKHPGGDPRAEYRDDRVIAVEQDADPLGWSLDEARRGVAGDLAPADAVYLRSQTRPDGAVVDTFTSASVGPFAAVYVVTESGRVVSYRVSLGAPSPVH